MVSRLEAQRWDAAGLRAINHVFAMVPNSSERFAIDKDLRRLPPKTVIAIVRPTAPLTRTTTALPGRRELAHAG